MVFSRSWIQFKSWKQRFCKPSQIFIFVCKLLRTELTVLAWAWSVQMMESRDCPNHKSDMSRYPEDGGRCGVAGPGSGSATWHYWYSVAAAVAVECYHNISTSVMESRTHGVMVTHVLPASGEEVFRPSCLYDEHLSAVPSDFCDVCLGYRS